MVDEGTVGYPWIKLEGDEPIVDLDILNKCSRLHPGDWVEHYKSKSKRSNEPFDIDLDYVYVILGFAVSTDDPTDVVVMYRNIKSHVAGTLDKTWVRNYDEFMEIVNLKDCSYAPDDIAYRFSLLDGEDKEYVKSSKLHL